MMFDAIAANRRRSYVLLLAFVVLIVGIAYVFDLYYEIGHYLVVPAAAFALFMAWGSYYYSDKIVLSMSRARPGTKKKQTPPPPTPGSRSPLDRAAPGSAPARRRRSR